MAARRVCCGAVLTFAAALVTLIACAVTVEATYPGYNPYYHHPPVQHHFPDYYPHHNYQQHHQPESNGRWPHVGNVHFHQQTTQAPQPQLRLHDDRPPPQEQLVSHGQNFRSFNQGFPSFGAQRNVLGAIEELSKRQELLYRLVACALLERKEREDPVCDRLKDDAENVFAVSQVIEHAPSSSSSVHSHLTNFGSNLYSGLIGFVSGNNRETKKPNVTEPGVVPTLAEYPEIEIIDLNAKKEIPDKRDTA